MVLYFEGCLVYMKILIVDDHALFREGLAYVLDELEQNMSIFNAIDYDTAMQALLDNPDLDLVLLDLELPGKDGFSVLKVFRQTHPTIPVIILSASNRMSDVQRVLDAGAVGFIPKNTTSKLMFSAVRIILAGGIYFPQSMMKKRQALMNNETEVLLTPRQKEVLDQLVLGSSNKNIAGVLGITEATAKMHITSILKKLGVKNRTQAAMAVNNSNLDSTIL
jgi:DNA-binding NarL/FixJ family response regulator